VGSFWTSVRGDHLMPVAMQIAAICMRPSFAADTADQRLIPPTVRGRSL
jgi:hypothetical protein